MIVKHSIIILKSNWRGQYISSEHKYSISDMNVWAVPGDLETLNSARTGKARKSQFSIPELPPALPHIISKTVRDMTFMTTFGTHFGNTVNMD